MMFCAVLHSAIYNYNADFVVLIMELFMLQHTKYTQQSIIYVYKHKQVAQPHYKLLPILCCVV